MLFRVFNRVDLATTLELKSYIASKDNLEQDS